MKVGVAGAGAVGAHYGVKLASAKMDVRLLARGAHLEAIRQQGLVHMDPDGRKTRWALPASDDPEILADCEAVLIGCKTTQLEALLSAIAPHIKPDAMVVTLQNGVRAPEMAAAHLPGRAIVAGSAFIGARRVQLGVIAHTAAGGIGLARWWGEPRGRLAQLAGAWARAGVPVRVETDARAMLWRKMVWNCGFNALTALLDADADAIASDPDASQIALEAMRETVRAAASVGVSLPAELPEETLKRTKTLFGVVTSMRQDLRAGSPTEIEAMNGEVCARLGDEAPISCMLTRLVRAAERRMVKETSDGRA